MSRYTCSPTPERRHVRVAGGGVIVLQSWPEHIAVATEAIRRRRIAESRVLCEDGQWR